MKNFYILIVVFLSAHFLKCQDLVDKGRFFQKNDIKLIEDRISSIENTTSIDILIYTTKSLNGKSAKEYGHDLFNKESIGRRGVNNGVLILLSKNDKALQITNGFGVEWILTDSISTKIIEEMIPLLKEGNFTDGILKGLQLMEGELKNISGKWKQKV